MRLPYVPESIVNEHPVTIYPGRSSPTKRVPPRTLAGSIERHRDVCRINVNDTVDHTNSSRENLAIASYPPPPLEPSIKFNHIPHYKPSKIPTQLPSPPPMLLTTRSSTIQSVVRSSPPSSPTSFIPLAINNHHHHHHNNNNLGVSSDGGWNNRKSDCDDFSDDSLEGQSLPPPPPPPIVPPPPSLSAPVTPSKRGSIAWEINLDDYDELAKRQLSATQRSEKVSQILFYWFFFFGGFFFSSCSFILFMKRGSILKNSLNEQLA